MFDPLGEELLDLGFLVSIKMRGLVSVYDVIYKEENISLAILNVKLSKGFYIYIMWSKSPNLLSSLSP